MRALNIARYCDQLEKRLLDEGVQLTSASPTQTDIDVVRTHADLIDEEGPARATDLIRTADGFSEWFYAFAAIQRLTLALSVIPVGTDGLQSLLSERVLRYGVAPDMQASQGKDSFYEIELASKLAAVGFEIEFAEPDIVISGADLEAPFGIAAKYVSSEKQIQGHISKALTQIDGSTGRGIVAVGLDHAVFERPIEVLDFRQAEECRTTLFPKVLLGAAKNEYYDRTKRHPSEDMPDVMLFSLSATGIDFDPPQVVEYFETEIVKGRNPSVHRDIEIIATRLRSLAVNVADFR